MNREDQDGSTMTQTNNSELFKQIYYDPTNPESFTTERRLFEAASKVNSNVTKDEVKKWLQSQYTYTLHKPARVKFGRNKTISNYVGEHYQADLADMSNYGQSNDGFKYILVVIDVFSRLLFAVPTKTKSPDEVKNALHKVFDYRTPEHLFTDRGLEFLGKPVQEYLKSVGTIHMLAQNVETKASLAERAIRTLKGKIYKYLTSLTSQRPRYIHVLHNIVQSINESKHRITKMRPIDINQTNERQVFRNIYGVDSLIHLKRKSSIFNVGDKVRRKDRENIFDKKYFAKWTDHIYTVNNVIKAPIPVYEIKDFYGNVLKKKFYNQELQKIVEDEFRIEKIIRRDKKQNRVLVKWLGYTEATWESDEILHKNERS